MTTSERVDRLTAAADQLQADMDRLRRLVALVMAAVVCVLVIVEVRT